METDGSPASWGSEACDRCPWVMPLSTRSLHWMVFVGGHVSTVGLTPSANRCSRQREFALLNNRLFFPLKSFFRNGTFVCLRVTQDLHSCLVLHELCAFPIDRRWREVCLAPAGILTCPFLLLGLDAVRFLPARGRAQGAPSGVGHLPTCAWDDCSSAPSWARRCQL